MNDKIFIPKDTTAISLGADRLATLLQNRGDEFTMIRNGSRGAFWLEPLVEVHTPKGRIAYPNMTVDKLTELLEAKGAFLSGDHAYCLGLTEDIPYLKKQQRLTFKRAGIADPTSIADYIAMSGFLGLRRAIQLTDKEIVEEVTESGLRGRGGAAFPAGIKWETVRTANAGTGGKYIVCNADEGDSGTFADRLVMESDPFMLIEGMIIAGLAVGATKGYVYIRSEYKHAFNIMNEAIEIALSDGYLGNNILGSGKAFHLELRLGAGAYICGEETSLLESMEGKRGLVRNKPPLPALKGFFGQPTVINNVLSLAAIPYILECGAAAYANYGMGRSKGTLPFQLAGNLRQGGVVELAFGISLKELLYGFGGGSASGRNLKAVQVGGPLGAYLPEEQWETLMDYESFTAIGAVLGHGGIVAFDDTADMAQMARFAMEFCAIESCGKCTPCRIGSTRGVEVIDRILSNIDRKENLILLDDLCQTMELGSMCAMGGMTPNPVKSAVQYFTEDFNATGDKCNG
ncbi:formate dehydrogenase [Photobacterium makurazakiensis]|uniref:formate dehydrogenase beta subunit n=1 Tax=Photobacterium makurazakiensis TaxID=2910234 RepID=UPI003D0F2D6C